jgi:microcystin-dependent protein
MATTTSGFRYPVSADDPDIPRDIRQLAEDIDNYLNATGGGAFNGVLPVIDINGNSTTANKLTTPRTISLTGSLSGSASFDGSANISISATVDPLAGTVPTGAMIQYLGTTAPNGWLFCVGNAVSRSTYSGLFDLFGTRYGAGNGSTTFNLPDLRSRFSRGSADAASLSGTAGGSATHQHTNTGLSTGSAGGHNHEVNIPSQSITGGGHQHTTDDHGHYSTDHSHNTTDHYHGTNSHSHDVNIGPNDTDAAGTHSHPGISMVASASSATFSVIADNTNAGSHSHGYNPPNTTSTASAPTTGGAADYTGAGNGNTTSGASAGNFSGGAHRTDGAVAGTGNTTTNVDHTHTLDPAAFNTTGGEGAHTHGQGTSDSISNIPPYIDVNFIVKI